MAKPKATPKEAIQKAFPGMYIPQTGGYVRNPYSGQGTDLSAEAYALYYAVKQFEQEYNRSFNPTPKAYRNFRKSLDLFRKFFPNEYMVLLD